MFTAASWRGPATWPARRPALTASGERRPCSKVLTRQRPPAAFMGAPSPPHARALRKRYWPRRQSDSKDSSFRRKATCGPSLLAHPSTSWCSSIDARARSSSCTSAIGSINLGDVVPNEVTQNRGPTSRCPSRRADTSRRPRRLADPKWRVPFAGCPCRANGCGNLRRGRPPVSLAVHAPLQRRRSRRACKN